MTTCPIVYWPISAAVRSTLWPTQSTSLDSAVSQVTVERKGVFVATLDFKTRLRDDICRFLDATLMCIISSMQEAAKLPEHLRASPTRPRTISEKQPGDIWWILFTSMKVDQDSRCFLEPSAERQMPGSMNRIIVRRNASGYHVTIPDSYQFLPYGATQGWIPVASIEDGIPDEEIFEEIASAARRCDRSEILRLLTILLSRDP